MFNDLPGFNYGWFLTFVQMVFMTIFAIGERMYFGEPAFKHDAPLFRHGIVAGAMTASRGLTNMSLQFLNYPTQVVFKSLKLLTVMIGSVLWVGRKYSAYEYIATMLTVISAVMFGLGDVHSAPQFSWLGIAIVLFSLVADSVHSNSQETLLQEHKATLRETMVYSNMFSAVGCFLVCLFSGELYKALVFCQTYPSVYLIFTAQSILTYLGVLCFVTTIKRFGVVLATTVTTVRKIVTVLLSFVFFPKPFNEKYTIGLLVFVASFGVQYYVQRQQLRAGLGIGKNVENQKSVAKDHKDTAYTSLKVDDTDLEDV